ncbi:MAG: T9SS type A sorting domain-containing protein [Candidatus Cloacimonetes bacterium]|nr:T9SS type A sorting domain-containing protein [Candidatus Cloacimonadota bacterium]
MKKITLFIVSFLFIFSLVYAQNTGVNVACGDNSCLGPAGEDTQGWLLQITLTGGGGILAPDGNGVPTSPNELPVNQPNFYQFNIENYGDPGNIWNWNYMDCPPAGAGTEPLANMNDEIFVRVFNAADVTSATQYLDATVPYVVPASGAFEDWYLDGTFGTWTAISAGQPIPPTGGTVTFPSGGSITFPPGGSGTIDLTFDPANPPLGIPVGNPQNISWSYTTSPGAIIPYPVTLRFEWAFNPAITYASSAILHYTDDLVNPAGWYALIDGNPIPAHAENLLPGNQAAILASLAYDFGTDPSFVEFETWTLSDWGMDGDNPLPVTLTDFAAEFVADNLTILWTTQSESGNMGWNIYRGESNTALEEDNTILINGVELIEGAGTTSEPTNYEFIDEYPVQVNETYWYWLESVSYTSDTGIYGPISLTIPEGETPPPLPTITLLKGNYPNPFNPTTFIQFDIKEGETAELTIYNIRGQIIESKTFEAGAYNYKWDSMDNASGVYFYKLRSESYSEFKKMMILK